MSRSQALSTYISAPSCLQKFISAVMTQTNLAREYVARLDRTIEALMERLDKQELRHRSSTLCRSKSLPLEILPCLALPLPVLSQATISSLTVPTNIAPPPKKEKKHWPPVCVKRHCQRKLRHRLVASRDRGTHFARYHCCSCSAFFGRETAVLAAVNVDQRPVLLPSSRFRHNALFLSSFSCSLIAEELHCDAWCSQYIQLCSLCVDLFACAAVESL